MFRGVRSHSGCCSAAHAIREGDLQGFAGIYRDLQSEAGIAPGSMPKSPELLNLWGRGLPKLLQVLFLA